MGDSRRYAGTDSLISALPHEQESDDCEATPTATHFSHSTAQGCETDHISDPTSAPIKKPSPKRVIVLTGMPIPALPPRPVFPAELENYQVQQDCGSSQYNTQMQSYLSDVRKAYENQLKGYDALKTLAQEDTYFTTAVVEELDAMDEDPFTLDSFENLMRTHASKGKDFILARVTTQDPTDETKLYHSYYGAHQINKVLFRTQPEEGLLHRMKARNPLNNMLVVGDVHYYIISAEDINAIKPAPSLRSPSVSISSHSSRMSRCSKLAAQAIASQSASARSSPILGSDMSLFSRSSDIVSPVSIISPSIARSILRTETQPDIPEHEGPPTRSRSRRGSTTVASSASTTPTVTQGVFQPGKPSRLRQAIDPSEQDTDDPRSSGNASIAGLDNSLVETEDRSRQGELDFGRHSASCHPVRRSQSPLFQNLMGGNRSRSNTMTSESSDHSKSSKLSCSSDIAMYTPSTPGSPSFGWSVEIISYNFKYLASDDDFLLRSAVRQIFKLNALEPWDAILFTISNSALREYSNPPDEQPAQQPPSLAPASLATPGQIQDDNNPPGSPENPQPERPTTDLIHGNSDDLPQSGITHVNGSSGMYQSMPSSSTTDSTNPSSADLSSSASPFSVSSTLTSLLNSSSPGSSSSAVSTLTSALSSSPSAPTDTVDALNAKRDSGHCSTASLPSEAVLDTGLSSSVGCGRDSAHQLGSTAIPQRYTSSASEGDLLHYDHPSGQERKTSRKIRQALNRFFSMA